MKQFQILFLLFFATTPFAVFSQTNAENCACCSENYNSFDFWLGEWQVFDKNEKLVGTNSITKQYDNCVIQEKWISQGKNRGTSYNFFDKTDKTWNQVWIDNSGFVLRLKGNYTNGSMVLKSKLVQGQNGKYYNQISWTLNNDGSVTQLWELFNEKHQKISVAFKGIYKKKLN